MSYVLKLKKEIIYYTQTAVAQLHFGFGETYLEADAYAKALKSYNAAIKLEPDYAKFYYGKAYVVYRSGNDLEQALETIQTGISKGLDCSATYQLLGYIYHKLAKYEEAIIALDKAIARNPSEINYHYAKARVLYDKGEYLPAIDSYQEIKDRLPPNAPIVKNCNEYIDKIEAHFKQVQRTNVMVGACDEPVSRANTYADQVRFNGKQGHGFAAERANHLIDKMRLKNAKILGDNNAPSGPDRLVSGVKIQSKYCQTGKACIDKCFNRGKFLYPDMQIEVPSDKYAEAVKRMEQYIRKGAVPGYTNPEQAKLLVRKGYFTYLQSIKIAKAGNIYSIGYDVYNGAPSAAAAGSLSAILCFGISIWRGESIEVAAAKSLLCGGGVGAASLVTSVLVNQLGRSSLEKSLRPLSNAIAKKLGSKVCAKIALQVSGKKIAGAAATSHVAKLLRGAMIGNVVAFGATSIALTTITTLPDAYALIRGRMSFQQLFKNVTTNATGAVVGTGTGMAGGAIGAWAGGAIGGTIGGALGTVVPGAGNIIGASGGATLGAVAGGLLVGGVTGAVGGIASEKASKAALDLIIDDDAKKMLKIFNGVFANLAEEYLLTEAEINTVCTTLQKAYKMNKVLVDLYSKKKEVRESYARELIVPLIDKAVEKRPKITVEQIQQAEEESLDILKTAVESEEQVDVESEGEETFSNLNEAAENGCFFTSLAQTLNEMSGKNRYNEKSLRRLCLSFYADNCELVDELNKKDNFAHDKYYLIGYSASKLARYFPNDALIRGRAHIEGSMLCQQLKLPGILIVNSLCDVDADKPTVSDLSMVYMATKQGYQRIVDKQQMISLLADPAIPKLRVDQSQRFAPVLSETAQQLNKQVLSNQAANVAKEQSNVPSTSRELLQAPRAHSIFARSNPVVTGSKEQPNLNNDLRLTR